MPAATALAPSRWTVGAASRATAASPATAPAKGRGCCTSPAADPRRRGVTRSAAALDLRLHHAAQRGERRVVVGVPALERLPRRAGEQLGVDRVQPRHLAVHPAADPRVTARAP
jgi:hypothetical protein